MPIGATVMASACMGRHISPSVGATESAG
jgi:hypothetical protein